MYIETASIMNTLALSTQTILVEIIGLQAVLILPHQTKNKLLWNGHFSYNRSVSKMFTCNHWFPVLSMQIPWKCVIFRRQVLYTIPAWAASMSYSYHFKLHLKILAQACFRVLRYPVESRSKYQHLTTLTTSKTCNSNCIEITHTLLCYLPNGSLAWQRARTSHSWAGWQSGLNPR